MPSWWLKSQGGGGEASCVEAPLFNIFRLYMKWSLVSKHICAGGGNVTFGIYIQFPPYIVVSAAFWATLKGDTARVVMTVL